ncbi:hypothetical protein ACYOEI_27310, partial [Singulisphaera rosea]
GKGQYYDAPTPEALHTVVAVLAKQIEEAKPAAAAVQVKVTKGLRASTDPKKATPLEIGSMGRARIDSKSRTNKIHYWLVDLPKGDYKVVVDQYRSDGYSSNIQGTVNWLNLDGALIQELIGYNAIDYRARGVGTIHLDEAQKGIINIEAGSGMVDYDIAVFEASTEFPVPFLRNSPTVTPIEIGQTYKSQPLVPGPWKNGTAYVKVTLPAGDYKVTSEFIRTDGANTNLQGSISFASTDGVYLSELGGFNEIAPRAAKTFKLMLSEELERIIYISPSQEMSATLKIEPLMEQ